MESDRLTLTNIWLAMSPCHVTVADVRTRAETIVTTALAHCCKAMIKTPPTQFASYIPNFWLKILSNVTSPIFSKCLCITLRTLQQNCKWHRCNNSQKAVIFIFQWQVQCVYCTYYNEMLVIPSCSHSVYVTAKRWGDLRDLPGVREDYFLASSGRWSRFTLLHGHEIAHIRQYSF